MSVTERLLEYERNYLVDPMFRDALFLARRDLRFMFRSRETWLWTFLMPIVFFYFIGTVTGNFSGKGDVKDPIIVSRPTSAGFLADRLIQGLQTRGYRLVDKGSRVQLSVPENFTASVTVSSSTSWMLFPSTRIFSTCG